MFDAAVAFEIENGFLVENGRIEIAVWYLRQIVISKLAPGVKFDHDAATAAAPCECN
jgi:hypothetical protein